MTPEDFKNELLNNHILPIEDRIGQIWPGRAEDCKITLLIRTPWFPDGGIMITSDSVDMAAKELARLGAKEIIA